jgi:hypothetical protein
VGALVIPCGQRSALPLRGSKGRRP